MCLCTLLLIQRGLFVAAIQVSLHLLKTNYNTNLFYLYIS